MRIEKLPIFFLLIQISVFGCQSGSDELKPPDIRYGEDSCDECRMIVNEAKYSAAFVEKNGEVRRFDDIGCLVLFFQNKKADVKTFWFKDFEHENWITGKEAVFLRSDSLYTPMGYGIISFRDKERTQLIEKENNGRILNLDEVIQLYNKLN